MEYNSYIHPDNPQIEQLIDELQLNTLSLEPLINKLLKWFDENISYSRLNSPYYPLQRSDLDVLQMKSGTCGDYSNLVVAVLKRIGYQVKYAYLTTDCYGNPQDHICAAVWDDNRWKLIDATLPYRKWMGFDCPHREYELLSAQEFYDKMKTEENNWTQQAKAWNNEKYAGLLYAPWIHQEIVVNTKEYLETVFFLLTYDSEKIPRLYINYFTYSPDAASTPIMCIIQAGKEAYRFSIKEAKHIWDEEQWSRAYCVDDISKELQTRYYRIFKNCIQKVIPHINEIIKGVTQ